MNLYYSLLTTCVAVLLLLLWEAYSPVPTAPGPRIYTGRANTNVNNNGTAGTAGTSTCPVDRHLFNNTRDRISFFGSGINMGVGNNICVMYGSEDHIHTKIIIYRERGSPRVMPRNWREMRAREFGRKYYGFGWSYEFVEIEGDLPPTYNYEDMSNVWVTGVAYSRHINHFAENLQVLSHLAANPQCYGAVDHLLFPGYNRAAEYSHSNTMMDIFMSLLPRTKLWSNFSQMRCFKQVKLLGRIIISSGGGLFYNTREAEAYRQYTLTYLNIKKNQLFKELIDKNGVPSKIRIFFSERSAREISNRQEVYDHINKHLGHVVNLRGFEMGKVSVEKQIQMASETDIMIGAHGTNLHNCLFMEPGGVVIEITQYHVFTEHFSNLAVNR